MKMPEKSLFVGACSSEASSSKEELAGPVHGEPTVGVLSEVTLLSPSLRAYLSSAYLLSPYLFGRTLYRRHLLRRRPYHWHFAK